MKSLKISRRWTDNAMSKRKKHKQWSTKHYIDNQRSSNANPSKNRGEFRCPGRVGSSCSTCDTSRVSLVPLTTQWMSANFIHFIYTLVITKSCINHTSWVPSGDILDVIISEKNTVGFYMWEPFMKNTCYRFRHLTELTGTLRNVNRFIKITTSYF